MAISFGTFKGHKLIQFGDPGDPRPFSFGQGKARKLLAELEADPDRVVAMLADIAGHPCDQVDSHDDRETQYQADRVGAGQ